MIKIAELKTGYMKESMGIDDKSPRFSWIMESDERGQKQSAYRIKVYDGKKMVWDSKKKRTGESNNIAYDGTELKSFTRYDWCVTVYDKYGREHSAESFFETAMMGSEFLAGWAVLPLDKNPIDPLSHDKIGRPAPYMRKTFEITKKVKKARAYATALGIYELFLNGSKVSDIKFAPGWTDYRKHVLYQTYDVTSMLCSGENVVGGIVGDGWFTGNVAIAGREKYGEPQTALKLYLRIEYEDGSIDVVRTGGFKATTGAYRYTDLLHGEIYDANSELEGWCERGYDDSEWSDTHDLLSDFGKLKAQIGPCVKTKIIIKPIDKTTVGDALIFDMGQNMVGNIELKIKGKKGQTVKIRYGEMLNADGSLYTENLRSALQTDIYIMKGSEEERYEPSFTFHGFRYVEITGIDNADIIGKVIYSDMDKTGHFECSNELVNKLYSNITWGQRGNFLDVPTDCPQRDERMGWSGDTQVFARTGCFNMDAPSFYEKYMLNMCDAQHADGAFTDVVPSVFWKYGGPRLVGYGNTAWGDAGIIVPWTLYMTYGDKRVIEENWEAMKAHMSFMIETTNKLIRPAGGYGDWLSVGEVTETSALNTAFLAYTLKLMAYMAQVIEKENDENFYNESFIKAKDAFNKNFVSKDGRIANDTQCIYVMALHFDLLSPQNRKKALKYLLENIDAKDGHLATGFVGVSYLLPALSENGSNEIAYDLITKDTYPSWGYSIRNGATTIWERWNSFTIENGFGDVGMNSFNHYSLGSCGEWMFRNCAGIEILEAGYKQIKIKPFVNKSFSFVNAYYDSIMGRIESKWSFADGFNLDVHIPANTSAKIYLPAKKGDEILENGVLAHNAEGLKFRGFEDGFAVYDAACGKYSFKVRGV